MFILTRPNGVWVLQETNGTPMDPVPNDNLWMRFTYSAFQNDKLCLTVGCEQELQLSVGERCTYNGRILPLRMIQCRGCGVMLVKLPTPEDSKKKLYFSARLREVHPDRRYYSK